MDALHIHAAMGKLRSRLFNNYRTMGLTRERWVELDTYFCKLMGGGNIEE